MAAIFSIAEATAFQLGVQTFPLIGKIPPAGYRWQEKKRVTPGVQDSDTKLWQLATGYGVLALPGSRLYIIDCDSPEFLVHLFAILPSLQDTFIVYSGSDHCHLYLQLSAAPELPTLAIRENNTEIASLRGHGSYVVGPGSRHPETGAIYKAEQQRDIVTLNDVETQSLLTLFNAATPEAVYAVSASDAKITDEIAAILRARGYRLNGEWLNGPCIYPERHKNQDRHPSFGFNIHTGVGHCFTCGSFSPTQVATCFGITVQSQPFVFQGIPPALNGEGIQVELNVTAELIRRKRYQAARFYALLTSHSKQVNGQHTYSLSELTTLGATYQLSECQVKKAVSQMTSLGLLRRTAHGIYRRVGLSQIRELLNLGSSYARITLPIDVCIGKPKVFNQAVLIAVEQMLPEGLSTQRIGQAAGMSRRTVYQHEQTVGVERETITERVGLARATVNFIKVFDRANRFVKTLNDVHYACKLAAQVGGKPWFWRQLPSKRKVPTLHRFNIESFSPAKDAAELCGEQQTGRQSTTPATPCRMSESFSTQP